MLANFYREMKHVRFDDDDDERGRFSLFPPFLISALVSVKMSVFYGDFFQSSFKFVHDARPSTSLCPRARFTFKPIGSWSTLCECFLDGVQAFLFLIAS